MKREKATESNQSPIERQGKKTPKNGGFETLGERKTRERSTERREKERDAVVKSWRLKRIFLRKTLK